MVDINKVTHLLSVFSRAGALQVLGESPLLSRPEWTFEPLGDPEHQVLMLSWLGDCKEEVFLIFTEQGISDARVSNTVRMKDVNGEEYEIGLWELTPVSVDKLYHTV